MSWQRVYAWRDRRGGEVREKALLEVRRVLKYLGHRDGLRGSREKMVHMKSGEAGSLIAKGWKGENRDELRWSDDS